MRHFSLLLIIMALCYSSAFGQNPNTATEKPINPYYWDMMQDPNVNFKEAQKAFEEYWEGKTDHSHNGWKQFKRWEYINKSRVQPNGKLPATGHAEKEYYKFKAANTSKVNGHSEWVEVGPTVTPTNGTGQPNGNGRINCMAFHPTDPDIFWAGAPSGGLWKTIDGGTNWSCLTDDLPTLGVSAILIHPTNPDIIYLGTGDRDHGDARGKGVYTSTDGGITWTTDTSPMRYLTVNMMIMNPSDPQIILAATSYGIYKTTDGGANWYKTTTNNYSYKDIKYKPGDPSVVYTTRSNHFYRSVDGGETWTETTNGLLSGLRITIGVSPDEPNWVYLLQASSNGFVGLVKSENSGVSFTTQSTSPNIMGYECDGSDSNSQYWYDQCIAVDPSDANTIYTGGINIWKSTDGGVTFNINSHWIGSSYGTSCAAPSVHADIHSLDFSPTNGNLYSGNDGGVYFTGDGGTSWTDISTSLAIAQVYKIGQSENNPSLVMNGYQDNGTAHNSDMDFTTVIGGDGMECILDPNDDDYRYGSLYYGDIRRKAPGSTSYYTIAKEGENGITESGGWVTPYTLSNDDEETMFVGYKNVWRSTNIKAALHSQVIWTQISSGEISNCEVIEHCKTNENILYVSRADILKRTDNCNDPNPTWVTCTNPDGADITDIVVDPNDDDIVYITMYGYVFKSEDRGMTWTDISGNLPIVAINCMAYDHNSNEIIYVGTRTGVYCKNGPYANWEAFDEGLPTVDVRELEIYYDNANPLNSKIKAATYGRGLWESPLFNISEFILVEAPNGGETWHTGDTYNITWTDNIDGNVNIELYNDDLLALTIATDTHSDGLYEWTIPDNLPVGAMYNIKIISSTNTKTKDYSDANFGINTVSSDGIAIIDLTGNNSGSVMSTTMTNQGIGHDYHSTFPADLSAYHTLFVMLGVFSYNAVLSDPQGEALVLFLTQGGNLYMEGGDTWAYDDPTDVHPMFNIVGLDDGGPDINNIQGKNDAFTSGLTYSYNGGNSFIDHIAPTGSGITIFENTPGVFNLAVSNDAGSYKTIGASFEFGGLVDGTGDNTKAHLLQLYLDFFSPEVRPENLDLQNENISAGEDLCSEADDITVAGSGTTYVVENGATNHLIASNSISIYPGFHAVGGSYFHALISEQTCEEITNPAPIVAEPAAEDPDAQETNMNVFSDNNSLKIYPNPFSYSTTIEYRSAEEGQIVIDIMTLTGKHIRTIHSGNVVAGTQRYSFDRRGLEEGIYMVVLCGESEKVVKKIIIN